LDSFKQDFCFRVDLQIHSFSHAEIDDFERFVFTRLDFQLSEHHLLDFTENFGVGGSLFCNQVTALSYSTFLYLV